MVRKVSTKKTLISVRNLGHSSIKEVSHNNSVKTSEVSLSEPAAEENTIQKAPIDVMPKAQPRRQQSSNLVPKLALNLHITSNIVKSPNFPQSSIPDSHHCISPLQKNHENVEEQSLLKLAQQ